MASYSNIRGMLAITKASLRTVFRSPQAVFFSLFFPIVLITIFGSIGKGGGVSVDVAFSPRTDSTNAVYAAISSVPVLNIEKADTAELMDRLRKGRIAAMIEVKKKAGAANQYDVHLITSSASQRDIPVLQSILRDVISSVNAQMNPDMTNYATVSSEIIPGRPYKQIDFYLPGMLGFSLIGAAVFGVAFVLYSLRETLVLKRMYTTPIKRGYIILGESLARIIFQLLTAVVIIAFGKFAYGFTLAHGWVTFVELMILCFLGLLVFMGFGFFISSIAKNQNVIPIYANLFMFPQYFLSGTFFPKSLLPSFLQSIIKFLPLTALNDSMRNVSFEGAHLIDCGQQIAILIVWAVLIYGLAARSFKWE